MKVPRILVVAFIGRLFMVSTPWWRPVGIVGTSLTLNGKHTIFFTIRL